MSFIIKPINALLQKDMDFITKMDPYVYITIGNRKFRSKTHKGGGKKPFWSDTFEVPVQPLPNNLQMKVQLYDQDLIKDDFLGEGWFNLSMLLNIPGKSQSRYIDLIRKGSRCGRILIEMTYNGPYLNQGPYMNQPQKQGWKQKASNFIKGYGVQNTYPANTFSTQPFDSKTNQNTQGSYGMNPYNQAWNSPPYNQPNMQSQGQNKENMWNQIKPTVGGNLLVSQNVPNLNKNIGPIAPNQAGWNPNQMGYNQKSGW